MIIIIEIKNLDLIIFPILSRLFELHIYSLMITLQTKTVYSNFIPFTVEFNLSTTHRRIYHFTVLQDVSTTATGPIRNYDSIKQHIFSIRLTFCVAACCTSVLQTSFYSACKGNAANTKGSMIYAICISARGSTIKDIIFLNVE